jgi:hypothetical protein
VCSRVGLVEPLYATPGESTDFYRFAGHQDLGL